MSSGGQSNASQTPFAPNYGQAQGISGLGAGLTGGGFGSNMGGGNAYAQKFKQPSMGMFPPTSPQPNQPPPGMELNPDYIEPRTGGVDTMEQRPSRFRPIQQPQPQTGGDIQYAGGSPGFYEAQLQAQQRQGGQGYGNPFGGFGGGYDQGYGNPFGGFGGGYDQGYGNPFGGFGGGYGNPFGGFGGGYGGGYGNPFGGFGGGYGGFNPMMGMGLGGMLGGYQGGFNPQSQAQAQMRAYQQNQQRNPNQPPPGMKLNPTYDAGYAMAEDMPPPGSAAAISKQRFIPSSPTEIQPQFGVVNRQNEGENSFEKLMATLPSEERAKYHGTSEHRNSANTLETIRRTRQDPEWGRYYQNKSDDEIYAGMQVRAI